MSIRLLVSQLANINNIATVGSSNETRIEAGNIVSLDAGNDINNIGATIKSEAAGKISSASGNGGVRSAAIDIDATGEQKGEPMRLVGHFEARGTRFYQVIVMGREKELSRENVDMFMSSFKPD